LNAERPTQNFEVGRSAFNVRRSSTGGRPAVQGRDRERRRHQACSLNRRSVVVWFLISRTLNAELRTPNVEVTDKPAHLAPTSIPPPLIWNRWSGKSRLDKVMREVLHCPHKKWGGQAYAGEIIVDQSEWDPLPSEVARREKVAVRIGVAETRLREKVKAAGGRWNPARRLWLLPMEQVLQLGLADRAEQDRSL